jgi:hypothetical protein
MIHECKRPMVEGENRVFAEHFMFDLKIKPRSRENAYPLLFGILPPELHRFRELCKSRTNKCYQLYMLMQKMEEVGRETLLNAVDAANTEGSPTLEKVEAILLLGRGPAANGEIAIEIGGALDGGDDYYVERRDPACYAYLLGGANRPPEAK